MSIRLALLPAACALATWALAASASAATNDGAQVSITHQCDTTQFGTFCIDDHIVSNLTSTPSGNTVLVGNTHFDASFAGAGGACSFQQSGRESFHAVFGPHANESSNLSRQEFRFPTACTAGDIIVCETVMHFHQVDGVVQFQRASAECAEKRAP